jgi:hypothetical protein
VDKFYTFSTPRSLNYSVLHNFGGKVLPIFHNSATSQKSLKSKKKWINLPNLWTTS